GAKALVLRAEGETVHVVLPGDRRVDNAQLRAILGTRTLRFATPEELLTLTGCTPGAVPPFGNLFGLPVLVDEELARRENIAFNAGSHTVSIVMRCADFLRLRGTHPSAGETVATLRRVQYAALRPARARTCSTLCALASAISGFTRPDLMTSASERSIVNIPNSAPVSMAL